MTACWDMEQLLNFGFLMLAVAVAVSWWRIFLPVGIACLPAYEIIRRIESGPYLDWYVWLLLMIGFAIGLVWQAHARSASDIGRNELTDEDRLLI